MRTNYFQVVSRPDMPLFQYRVDMSPEVDFMPVRRSLLRVHEKLLGRYVFDGTLLHTTNRLRQLEFHSTRNSDQADITITLRLVGEIENGNPVYNSVNKAEIPHGFRITLKNIFTFQVVNIIFRRCLSMLNLTEIKRKYYDSEAAIQVSVSFIYELRFSSFF